MAQQQMQEVNLNTNLSTSFTRAKFHNFYYLFSCYHSITELAEQIKNTVDGLQNIDNILDDTRDDLRMVQELKARADKAR